MSDKLLSSAAHLSSAGQTYDYEDEMPPLNEDSGYLPLDDSADQPDFSSDIPAATRQPHSLANAMKVMNRSGARSKLVKSPGGSIRSVVTTEESDRSSQVCCVSPFACTFYPCFPCNNDFFSDSMSFSNTSPAEIHFLIS